MVRHNARVIWDVVDGATVLCDTETGELFEMNATAGLVWVTCADGSEVSDMVERVHAAYPKEEIGTIKRDVEEVLKTLKSHGLLEDC
jgi:hypothetical protein